MAPSRAVRGGQPVEGAEEDARADGQRRPEREPGRWRQDAAEERDRQSEEDDPEHPARHEEPGSRARQKARAERSGQHQRRRHAEPEGKEGERAASEIAGLRHVEQGGGKRRRHVGADDQRGGDAEDEQAPPIATNAEYLELAVRNLHENAVQHTHPGGAVRWCLGGAALTVENDGPIIPPDELAQIGTRFFRGRNRHPAGSGLGLAIARAALGKIGALVTVENRSDRGGVVCTIVLDGERPLPLTPP